MTETPTFVKQSVVCPMCFGAGGEAPIDGGIDQWYVECELCLGTGKVPSDLANEYKELWDR